MKKTRSAVVLAGAALAVAAMLCSSAAVSASTNAKTTNAKTTITWWSWTSNPKTVIANFEKAHPNISIKVPPNYGSGATFYPKLTTALEGGTGPCVTQVEYSELPEYIAKHDLVNIAQYVSSYKKDFPAWVWQQVSQGSAVYAIPEDIGPIGLMYQPAVLKQYNLPVPTTWSQFASDAAALHKADPSMYLDPFVLNDPSILESLWWQAGARPFQLLSNGTWKINVAGTIEQKVTNFWATLVKQGLAPVDNDFTTDWTHHIAQDKYAAILGAAWGPDYVISSNLPSNSTEEWAVTQLPQWTAGAHATANWGGSTNAVTKDCPSQDVKDAALFAAYINTSKSGIAIDEEATTNGGRGLFPAAIARASVPQFNAPVPFFSGNINALFSQYAGQVVKNWVWSPFDAEFRSFMSTELASAIAGKQTWTQALKVVESQLVRYAKAAGYSVES
jgi:multiple sugar transport system substrate-binding protein